MAFRPYHTGLRKQVDFEPLTPGKVRIYNCGPTVYGVSHIGNFRSFVFADLLRRYLEWPAPWGPGYDVTQVMNITDVGHLTEDDRADAAGEDKLQKAARELGWDPFKVARHFEEIFHANRKLLRVKDAHQYPRATDHVREMLVMIQKLIDTGHAYVVESGEVYYDLATFPKYGDLSGKKLEELVAGARVDVDTRKKHPGDFALWKVDNAHLMQWDPHDAKTWEGFQGGKPKLDPHIKKGFPGWHIECSAMSMRYLGETFDIHTGGEDNIFPHHECEIAQSEGATGKQFARYWMHARHLLVNNKKMAKREGTLYTLEDLTAKGYSPIEVRYLLLSNHYRQPMNFTLEGLDAARASIARIQQCYQGVAHRGAFSLGREKEEAETLVSKFRDDFRIAMDDDLNTPNALAALFSFVREANRESWSDNDGARSFIKTAFEKIDNVLDVIDRENRHGFVRACRDERMADKDYLEEMRHLQPSPSDPPSDEVLFDLSIQNLLEERLRAKRDKEWALADRIRKDLQDAGVTIEDGKDGTRYTMRRV